MKNVEFTNEELTALIVQIQSRIDHLKQIQISEAKKGNVKAVIQMENQMNLIISGKDKMEQVLYKNGFK